MRILAHFTFISALFLLSSCTDLSSGPELAWVAKLFVGGRQCDTSSHYTPPNVEKILNDAGISVYGITVEPYGVCAACGCPQYAAMHYALIGKQDLARAMQLDFQQKNPP
jgi:hypothetical protein